MTSCRLINVMLTEIREITPESLQQAKDIIYSSGVVGIPTETVYGLGGSAFDDEAVRKIFEVKGRPNDNPLIAHVHQNYDIMKIVDYDPPFAKKLREAFLPGPLTLVYPSTGKVSPYVSCGLNTLAIRVPSHTGAQEFLKCVDIPIVAPSANISKHVSPTSAKHVFDDFNGKIPLILDGGASVGGIESTVCDVTGEVPIILRPGLITKEMIESVCGTCEVYAPILKAGDKAKSPGMMYKHYSPRCRTIFFESNDVQKARQRIEIERNANKARVSVLCEKQAVKEFENLSVSLLNLGETEREMAANLYELLRRAEEISDVLIAIAPKKQDGVMVGVMNRLKKACLSTDISFVEQE